MTVRIRVAGVVGLALFVGGCLTGRALSGADARSALDRTLAEYNTSTETKNPERIVRFFRPDVVVLSPQSREPAIGLDVNRAAWARFFALPKAAHSITTREVVTSACGDIAYSRGAWTATFQRPDSTMVPGDGELITIWRRDPSVRTGEPASEWKAALVMAHRTR